MPRCNWRPDWLAIADRAACAIVLALGGALSNGAAFAQTDKYPGAGSGDSAIGPDIVVVANRLPGDVNSTIKAIATIGTDDIASYGASSLEELVELLGPQVNSSKGRSSGHPIILLNGRRTGSFRELRNLPPEAIARIQIFPEELAIQYGYSADQRVMNIVLKPNYSARTAEAKHAAPTQGGSSAQELELGFSRNGKASRLDVSMMASRSGLLSEQDRGIIRSDARSPFSRTGTILALSGIGEIDPALSQLAGFPVQTAVAPVLNGAAHLSDFASTAGQVGQGDDTGFRSLLADEQQREASITWSRQPAPGSEIGLNAAYNSTDRMALLGLGATRLTIPASSPFSPFTNDVQLARLFVQPAPLRRFSATQTTSLGAKANGNLGQWHWTATVDANIAITTVTTHRTVDFTGLQAGIDDGTINPFVASLGDRLRYGPADYTRSNSKNADLVMLLTGSPMRLPAGPVNLSVKAEFSSQWLNASASRSGPAGTVALSRKTPSLQASIDIPLAGSEGALGKAVGEIAINANARIDHHSDYGALYIYGGSLRWAPVDGLDLTGSYTQDSQAPTMAQLGEPALTTPGFALYDYATGQTALIDRITGGNGLLRAERRRDIKLSASWSPNGIKGLNLSLEYFRNRSSNVPSDFPFLSAQIEATFPDRLRRDAVGQLTLLDVRPISLAHTASDGLHLGVDWRGSLPTRSTADKAKPEGQSRHQRPDANAMMGMFGRDRARGVRLSAGIDYRYRLKETALIRSSIPILDLLSGDALNSSGGAPRHEIEFNGGIYAGPIALRTEMHYHSGSRFNASPLAGGTLFFSPLTTIDLRLSLRPEDITGLKMLKPLLNDSRIRIAVTNLFNARQTVRDSTGNTPLSYQPAYLDPLGRTLEISVRKQF